MSDFIVEKLTKSVGDKTVFKEISFIIHDLDRIGIIGVNGTGKTTLLDVVSERIGFDGDVSPFTKANGYKIAYLTQYTGSFVKFSSSNRSECSISLICSIIFGRELQRHWHCRYIRRLRFLRQISH